MHCHFDVKQCQTKLKIGGMANFWVVESISSLIINKKVTGQNSNKVGWG